LRQGLRFDIIEYPECGGEGYYFSKARDSIRVARLHTPWEIVRSLDTISEGACDRLALSHIERSTVRRCSAITSPTHALATLLQSRWGLKTIRVFPNPLPVSHYPLATGSDWIYTGRVEYRKGVHTLIEAYELLTQTSRPPRLRLIGKPYGNHPNGSDYGKYIADRIGRLQYPENIEWIRGMPGASIPEQLQKSAAAIFPSLWENLSYSCIEAMASGLAIVASRTGGYPEIITECETGLLFQPGNSADLAAQLAKLLAQPHLRKDLGINARKKASELFDTPLVCRTMVAFYEDLKRMGS
jgi:glycosyltransferase involved in cell wall biosynthesis